MADEKRAGIESRLKPVGRRSLLQGASAATVGISATLWDMPPASMNRMSLNC